MTLTNRHRVAAAIVFAAILLAPLAAQEEFPDDEDIFRVDVNLITLMFSVKDAEGRFVNDLPPDRFAVYEDGVEQEIRYFEQPDNPSAKRLGLTLAFLIDVSGSTFSTRSEQLLAARTFFDNLEQFSRVGVFGFTDELMVFQDFTSDRGDALEALADARRHLGRTAIYDAMNTLVRRMSQQQASGRKVVIVISDGMDDNYSKSVQALSYARTNGVTIYTILVPSAAQLYIHPDAPETPEDKQREEKRKAFARLSQGTGGLHFSGFEAILDFDQTLAQITDSVYGSLYRLAYVTDDAKRPKEERDIRVRVRDSAYDVSLPFTKLPEKMQVKKNFIAALFGSAGERQDLDIDMSYQEIGAALDLLKPRTIGGETGQPFRLKINPLTLSGDRLGVKTQLGIVGQLVDREGNEVARLREVIPVEMRSKQIAQGEGVIYTNKLLAPEGTYNFRLAVLEVSTWKMSAFEAIVQIGNP